ncbi:hypothetical protein [Stenotrophomonas sp. T8]|uniref:hypothetical protein n=1 Tax=Stenotrophomonas sp. T8 TaxID=3446365 RepID=UPI003F72E9BB
MWLEPFNGSLTVLLAVMYALGLAGLSGAVGILSQTVLAIGSGVLGGRIANAVSVVNSEAILKARGTVAVRSLNLMLRNVGALDTRVGSFLREAKAPLEAKNYEEIREMCRVLSEEGVTSIENWVDIVPEAKAASVVGHLTELRDAINQLEAEKIAMQEQLNDAAVAGAEAEQNLRDQIAAKDQRINTLENAYTQSVASVLSRLSSGDRTTEKPKSALEAYLEASSNQRFTTLLTPNGKRGVHIRPKPSSAPPPPKPQA